jgi:hypothetical protein
MSTDSYNTFRTDEGRQALETDNNVNSSFRIYIPLTEEDKAAFNSTDEVLKQKRLAPHLYSLTNGVYIASKEKVDVPTRVQVFFNQEDPYYSIVAGYKIPPAAKAPMNTIKYHIGMEYFKNDLHFIIMNGFEVFKHISDWDRIHCSEKPYMDWNKKETATFFTEKLPNFIEELNKEKQKQKQKQKLNKAENKVEGKVAENKVESKVEEKVENKEQKTTSQEGGAKE